ncbi:MAG: hypothetical protein GX803_06980 [Lentisphaerae bacterium]|nr:hypothetical protein [Lentisphaerota bacterium]
MKRCSWLLWVGCTVWALSASAVPLAIPYQGVLSEVVDGVVTTMTAKSANLEVRLYSVATGGTALWGREVAVTLDNGAFNMELSDSVGSPLGGGTLESVISAATGTLYIGLKVKGGEEITPRQRLLSSAYAIAAKTAHESAGNFTVKGKLTAASNAVVTGNLTLNNTLNVHSNAHFEAWVWCKNGISVAAGAPATFYTDAVVKAPATISGYGTIPIGGIIMWSGTENQIPDGWALCNGSTVNGKQTPDLRGRFVVGAGTGSGYNVNNTGGANQVTLTVAQMPKHSHTTRTSKEHAFLGLANSYWAVWYDEQTVQTGEAGGDQPHENRPPYYALCYIMRVK